MKVTTDQTTSHFWIRQCFKSGIRALSDHSPSPREQNFVKEQSLLQIRQQDWNLCCDIPSINTALLKLYLCSYTDKFLVLLTLFLEKKNWCRLQTDDIVYYEIFFPSMAQKYFNTSQYSVSTFKMIIRIHKIT